MSAEVSDVSLIQDEDLLRRMVSDRVLSYSFVTCLLELNLTLKWLVLLLRFRKLPVPNFGSEVGFPERNFLFDWRLVQENSAKSLGSWPRPLLPKLFSLYHSESTRVYILQRIAKASGKA
jgi:hypothetical protein